MTLSEGLLLFRSRTLSLPGSPSFCVAIDTSQFERSACVDKDSSSIGSNGINLVVVVVVSLRVVYSNLTQGIFITQNYSSNKNSRHKPVREKEDD